jgi:hypothetical protein
MNKFENVQFDFGIFRTTGRLANTPFAAALHTVWTSRYLTRKDPAKSAGIGRKTLQLIEETRTHTQLSGMCLLANALDYPPRKRAGETTSMRPVFLCA